MRPKAPAREVERQPASLMQRLARVAQTHENDPEFPPSRAGVYFAIGLIGSALASALVLLAIEIFVRAPTSAVGARSPEAITASLAPSNPLVATAVAYKEPVPVAQEQQPDAF